jgi:hypothetical protein
MKDHWYVARLLVVAVFLGWAVTSHAAGLFSFGDTEKPNPEFQRSGQEISAKFIPRAKSTSVTVTFGVSAGGILNDVKGVDFETVDRPEVDVKNFKSAVFEIHITKVKPGETAALSIRSDFFTKSTAFFVYNPKQEKPWKDAQAGNRPLDGRVRELVVSARDGGELDADGLTDGRVTVIGGPRDSFWGYALGTLFIRFFGIFIVLLALMIGMIVSGFVFRAIERRKTRQSEDQKDSVKALAAEQRAIAPLDGDAARSAEVPEEVAAAIGTALHLHLSSMRRSDRSSEAATSESSWASDGRKRMMNDRLSVFNRFNR